MKGDKLKKLMFLENQIVFWAIILILVTISLNVYFYLESSKTNLYRGDISDINKNNLDYYIEESQWYCSKYGYEHKINPEWFSS